MIKNIGKASLWGVIYSTASTIGFIIAMICMCVGDWERIIGIAELSQDQFLEAFTQLLLEFSVPATCIAGIICIIVFCIYKLITKRPVELLEVKMDKALFCFSFGAVFNIIISYGMDLLWDWLPEVITDSALDATSGLLENSFHWSFLLLAVGIIVPISEEIVFRHGVCRMISRSNTKVAIIMSAIIFGLAHGNVLQGIYTAALGVACCYVMLNGQNLWYAIFIHMGLNSTSVIASAIPDEELSNIVFLSMGGLALIILSTMLIHKPEIRALFKKPAAVYPDDIKQNTENIISNIHSDSMDNTI